MWLQPDSVNREKQRILFDSNDQISFILSACATRLHSNVFQLIQDQDERFTKTHPSPSKKPEVDGVLWNIYYVICWILVLVLIMNMNKLIFVPLTMLGKTFTFE